MALKSGELKIAIDSIAAKHGGCVTPRNVVDEASKPNHPLHNEFDWDDASAADKHRLAVAASLLRKIEYVGRDVVGREVAAVAYVYDAPTQTHVQLSVVARNKKQSHALMMQEIAQCESHIRRAQRICDVLHLREELDELLHACIDFQERVEKTMKTKPAAKRGREQPRASA